MKKVLFVATLVKNHMMEFHLPYLKMFQEAGWETAVASKNDYDDPADCRIPHCDTFYDLPFQRSPLKKDNLTAFFRLRKIIREGSFDLIHCHTPVGAMVARLAAMGARRKGTKVVYTAHGLHFYKDAPLLNWLIYFPVEWLLAPLTDVLITINQEDYARAKKLLRAKKVVYIPGVGIDASRFRDLDTAALGQELQIPENTKVLLSVGDLNKNKNHRAVLEALSLLKDPGYFYLVCGRGELKQELEDYAATLGLSDRVRFLGYRDDVPYFYALADVFVFPSFREGLSVSVMEAMASGKPVVCSRIRGNTDMVCPWENGFLIDPSDPGSIVTALKELADPVLSARISEENRKKAADFDLGVILQQYRAVYEEVIGEKL